jgi:trigger factor
VDKVIDYKNEDSTAHVTVTVKKDDIASRYELLLQEYLKDAQLPGYRKGKVPKTIFEKKYAAALQGETANKLIEEHMDEALSDLDRAVVRFKAPQVIEASDISLEQDFTFTLKADVMPLINIDGYEKISLPSYTISVADSDVDAELKRLQEQNAFVVNKTDASITGDVLDINYCELDASGNEIAGSARENFVFTIGGGQNLYDLDDDLVGMSAGAEKIVQKSFAADHKNADLAGKDVSLKVVVNSVKGKNLPDLDDEFAQDVNEKFKTLADLKKDIKEKFEENSVDAAKMRRCTELLAEISKTYPFALPEGLVLNDIEARFSQLARQMNISEDQLVSMIGGSAAGLIDQWRPESEASVRSKLIIDHIAESAKITVSDDEFAKQSALIAKQYNSSIEDLTKQVGEVSFKAYIEEQVRTAKALDILSSTAKVSETCSLSMEEFNKANRGQADNA